MLYINKIYAHMFFNVFSVGSLLPLNFGSGLTIVSWYL